MRHLLVFLTLVLIQINLVGQNIASAEKSFDKAISFYKNNNKKKAKTFAEKAFEQHGIVDDTVFAKAAILRAELALNEDKKDVALLWYEKIPLNQVRHYKKVVASMSKLYLNRGEYDKCLVMTEIGAPHEQLALLQTLASFRKDAVDNPQNVEMVNLGRSINTTADEHINGISQDGRTIFFTRSSVNSDHTRTEKIYSSTFDTITKTWSEASIFIDLPFETGALSLSTDATEAFFTVSLPEGCDIFYSKKENDSWSTPQAVKEVNTKMYESQAMLSADGRELYFVRGRDARSTSLFVARRDDKGRWGRPVSVDFGMKVEGKAPFYHSHSEALYFASSSLVGLGENDIFLAFRKEGKSFEEPINLGFPINTTFDEMNFVVTSDGTTAFLSTNRDGGEGGFDIYRFILPEVYRAKVYEKEEVWVMKNITFDVNSSAIIGRHEGDDIDKLISYMRRHEDVKIEISGHTDDSGDELYNMALSVRRAEALKMLLIEAGISGVRIEVKGFGALVPVGDNTTEEGRRENRRIEVREIR